MERKDQTYNRDYFVFPHPFWIVAIPFGIGLLGIATFAPDRIPWYLGPLGEFAKHLGKNYTSLCMGLHLVIEDYFKLILLPRLNNERSVMTLVVHCIEAAYAEKLCIDKKLNLGASVKWTLQTLIFGFASLIRLAPYPPDKKLS